MKEYLAALVRSSPTSAHGRNVVREYLQARILGCLQRAGAMVPLAFHGGTALRILYASDRYSEDVDESNWRETVRNRLQTMAWDRVVADVRPFLEPSADPDLLTLDNVLRVLG